MGKERYEFGQRTLFDNKKEMITFDGFNLGEFMNSITNILNQQDARIKELESNLRVSNSQLASSELKYNELENNYKKQEYLLSLYLKNCSELNLENQQLKEQNKQLKIDCAMYQSANYLINEYGIDRAREIMFQSERKFKQSQNNKAIECLENLKNDLFDYSVTFNIREERAIRLSIFREIINNQIKELRSEK